jgi:hypothetical protein
MQTVERLLECGLFVLLSNLCVTLCFGSILSNRFPQFIDRAKNIMTGHVNSPENIQLINGVRVSHIMLYFTHLFSNITILLLTLIIIVITFQDALLFYASSPQIFKMYGGYYSSYIMVSRVLIL